MTNLLWNYKTEEFDNTEVENDEQAVLYIPDTDFAKSAFKSYRQARFSISDSISKTIQLFIFTKRGDSYEEGTSI